MTGLAVTETFMLFFAMTFLNVFVKAEWIREDKNRGEKRACEITVVVCFPGYQPAFSWLVVSICRCYGENKSISHGYQPVPRLGSAIEIQDQVFKIPSKNCGDEDFNMSFREFLILE